MKKIILTGTESGWWFVCFAGRLWLPKGDAPYGTAEKWSLVGKTATIIGEWQGELVWLIAEKMPIDMVSPRMVAAQDEGLFRLAGRGVQLAEFYRSHRYCGYCGTLMRHSPTEWACLCDHCQERYYPQIAPCIIVAIRRDSHILLAQHRRHKQNPVFTVLAGFVEVGETLEEAVAREVMEESQIKIKNIRYVSSQPWPFPHSLMMGFLADYDSGEIEVDPHELIQADWYHYDELPKIPSSETIARRLIEDTVALCRNQE
ncbi:NAD(+) diphosphatase [Moellerella wisconsensis]|uniref:NAD-capped RNA hydrolase NudC n=3 Tax=Moellerella wisconsensis TaxID=158849 RepID=A0A0N0IBK8_9GAMM|nr:NAD(+) diphosphatase [Moellerella wisconsensis]KLN97470.1 NADH pyrophosphatase [Moellerella wisconsensis]KPD03721.1 NADH pyrophosphatase [Moellerella wisconsensis ATCC 35017]UNH24443.1 NAD(+) diphosphatase [Moellerella wisconsensis]UNH27547.1 NAD(+) diphosphatase [Moellerella wisconsensis]UNH31021.1 NAD(+) diphosphatase [Moellerella wisconsensis]